MHIASKLIITLLITLATGCIDRVGSGATGDELATETSGDGDGDPAAGTAPGGDLPVPGDDVVCIDEGQAVSCWSPWEGAWAQVYPACQRQAAVDLGVWSPSFDPEPDLELDMWGPSVLCHTVVGTDLNACFYIGRVLLTRDVLGWAPLISSVVLDHPEVGLPCEDTP